MKTRYIIALTAVALMFSGCQKNELQDTLSGGGIIRFAPSVALTQDEDGTKGSATRGALINDNTNGGYSDIALPADNSFYATAWTTGASTADFGYTKVLSRGTGASQYWITVDASDRDKEYLWKKDETKTFYAYANLPSTTGAASVACTAATEQTLTYDVTKVPTAAAQTDILLGFYTNGSTAKTDGLVPIDFSHPLTAVQFKLGTIIGASTFVVNSISIEGVYASGKAEMTPTSAAETDPKDRFAWTKTDGSAFTAGDATATVSQTITVQPTTSEPAIGEAFLLIPQTFASNATSRIAIACTMDGVSRTLYWPLASAVWKAGYTNTYTIGFDGNTYTFELSTPSNANLTFNNTTASSSKTINLTSKAQSLGGATSDAEWLIKSVQVGSADPTPVGGISFSDIGGLRATTTSGSITLNAAERTSVNFSLHDYWVNKDGISGDTDGTGWSPKSWGSDGLDKGTIDLSKLNFQTETTDNPMTTANCYIIRHAGTYKLPLVYGNAIKNGATNEQSYAPTLTKVNSYGLTPFVNSKNKGITSPFIENATGCGGDDLKCAVIWQDKAEVVKSLQITPGTPSVSEGEYTSSNVRYLQFSISQEDICQNNALICVYKDANGNGSYDSGEAVWSWHIWTTNNPALLSSPISVWNNSTPSQEYKFFPLYNLGWIDPESYPSRSDVKIVLQQKKSGKEIEIVVTQPFVADAGRGCWYQFGRKDPTPTTDVPGFTIIDIKAYATTLSDAITKPNIFYLYTGDWCKKTYYNLWTGKKNEQGKIDQDADMIKTIYDPSPVGYKMPASNAFTGFTTTGVAATDTTGFNVANPGTYDIDKGWYFYTVNPGTESTPTIFFPAAGWRSYGDGSVSNFGSSGYYWPAVINNSAYGLDFDFSKSSVSPLSRHRRASGCSVRPVQE